MGLLNWEIKSRKNWKNRDAPAGEITIFLARFRVRDSDRNNSYASRNRNKRVAIFTEYGIPGKRNCFFLFQGKFGGIRTLGRVQLCFGTLFVSITITRAPEAIFLRPIYTYRIKIAEQLIRDKVWKKFKTRNCVFYEKIFETEICLKNSKRATKFRIKINRLKGVIVHEDRKRTVSYRM